MISGCKLAYGWTLLVIISSLTEGALQGSSGDQACLHGQRETSDNCGTNGSEEADGAIEQHVSPQTTTGSHATVAAAVQWSSPADPDRCAPGRLASLSCRRLPAACLSCRFNASCVYGANVTVLCRPADGVACTGVTVFNRTMVCRYCYQTPAWQHDCSLCNMMSRGRKYYRANCTVAEDVVCMGQRTFHKRLFCKWTKGDRWSTALALSVVLGGFGVDRFYLGHWQEGIGKFFSFGGLGVWTLIDVVLIAIGYLSPADGSLYIT